MPNPYTAQFTTAETKLFTIGDVFEVTVASSTDSAAILGVSTYILTAADLENKVGNASQVTVDRTTTYNIQGVVLDKNCNPAVGAVVAATSSLAQVSASTNQNGKYAIKFLDFVIKFLPDSRIRFLPDKSYVFFQKFLNDKFKKLNSRNSKFN